MSNAFAPIVRARPNPIFGRPVHQGSPPFDYSPILLLKPFGFRIAPDTLSSGIHRATGSRSVLAVSGFRLRARLDFSIPSCSPGQRGITPAFGYSAPHPSAEGTSTPMIHALPSAHYSGVRPPASVRHRLRLLAFSMRARVEHCPWPDAGSPSFRCIPFARDVFFDPGRVATPRAIGVAHVAFDLRNSLRPCGVYISWLN